ncbi:MAG: VOC family protein [Haloarculaceae archaeon]
MADMDEGGIVFYRTEAHDAVVEFYTDRLGATVWLEQPGCTILDYRGFRVGFCDRTGAETEGTLTFVVPDRAAVDAAFERLEDRARDEPHYNDRYDIYQFFAEDPEGRTVEVQSFE